MADTDSKKIAIELTGDDWLEIVYAPALCGRALPEAVSSKLVRIRQAIDGRLMTIAREPRSEGEQRALQSCTGRCSRIEPMSGQGELQTPVDSAATAVDCCNCPARQGTERTEIRHWSRECFALGKAGKAVQWQPIPSPSVPLDRGNLGALLWTGRALDPVSALCSKGRSSSRRARDLT